MEPVHLFGHLHDDDDDDGDDDDDMETNNYQSAVQIHRGSPLLAKEIK